MFDFGKIDAFFNGDKPFDNRKKDNSPKMSPWQRFVKLGFPCVAAVILGVMIVLPNIKKSIDLHNDITIPRKNELEKLHIEETVFNSTDNKNRVSTIIADSVDEVAPGSNEVKITNPHGNIPTDNGEVLIFSEEGYFNQKENILTLANNVKAIVDTKTTINTDKAIYEFNNDYGYGKNRIYVAGEWGTIDAEGFEYYKKDNILVLTGHSIISTKDGILTSEKETKYFQNENKTISIGNVVIHHEHNILKADKVIGYFSGEGKKELQKVEAFGNVFVITPKGTAKGDKGIYNPKKSVVELIDNVQIEQNGNFIKGSRAETNLTTSISKMTADKDKGERITGTFYNKRKSSK